MIDLQNFKNYPDFIEGVAASLEKYKNNSPSGIKGTFLTFSSKFIKQTLRDFVEKKDNYLIK